MWLTVGDRLSASADWGGFTPSEASVPAIVKTSLQPKPTRSYWQEKKSSLWCTQRPPSGTCKTPQTMFSNLEEQK